MKGLEVYKTNDEAFRKTIEKRLKENNGCCPCSIERTPDTKCMCKDFREKMEDDNFSGPCHCGYYIKKILN